MVLGDDGFLRGCIFAVAANPSPYKVPALFARALLRTRIARASGHWRFLGLTVERRFKSLTRRPNQTASCYWVRQIRYYHNSREGASGIISHLGCGPACWDPSSKLRYPIAKSSQAKALSDEGIARGVCRKPERRFCSIRVAVWEWDTRKQGQCREVQTITNYFSIAERYCPV